MYKYKEIADALDVLAESMPEYTDADPTTVLVDGTFKIKCVPSRPAVKKVAAKYRKGAKLHTTQRKDWGVWGSGRPTVKQINDRYAGEADRYAFLVARGVR